MTLLLSLISILFLTSFYLNKNQSNFSRLVSKTNNIINEFPEYKFGSTENINIEINNKFSPDNSKLKILIVGDSHGRDLARALISYKENLKRYEFSFIETNILESYVDNTLANLQQKNIIENSNFIFLSRQFTSEKYQIKKIKKLGNFVKNLNKNFVIVGSAPEFYTSEGDLLLTYLIENEKNKKSLKNKDYLKINKYFYSKLKTYLFDTNIKLKNTANELGVNYIDRFEFTCQLEDNICWAIDEKGNRNFFDYSHFTKSGVIYFGKKINELGWLEKITQLNTP